MNMKHLQRILSLLLVCTMVLSLIPDVLAQEAHTVWTDLLFGDETFRNQMNFTWDTVAPIPGIEWDGDPEYIYMPAFTDDEIVELPEEDRFSDMADYYVKDNIAFTAAHGVDFYSIRKLAAKYGFVIIGYLAPTRNYLIKSTEGSSYEELQAVIQGLKQEDLLESETVVLEYIETPVLNSYIPNDPWDGSEWNESTPGGNNWGMEAIHAPTAWMYKNQMKHLNVGVLDGVIYPKHEDLDVSIFMRPYADFWKTFSAYFWGALTAFSHGTHVSGTFAAKFDNHIGVSGVFPNGTIVGGCFDYLNDEGEQLKTTGMLEKYYILEMRKANVKVINMSYGYHIGKRDDYNIIQSDASYREKVIQSRIDFYRSLGWESFFSDLEKDPWDYVFVHSAGNEKTDARVNGWPEAVSQFNDSFASRLIVVGSFGKTNWEKDSTDYAFSKAFSNYGSRVDVLAPGERIYSTVIGYPPFTDDSWYQSDTTFGEYWDGTSMAAPHVSGTAAMIWSLAPDTLTGPQVKSILLNSAYRTIPGRYKVDTVDEKPRLYRVLDAGTAVECVVNRNGFITGTVTNSDGRALEGVVVSTSDGKTSAITDNKGTYWLMLPSGSHVLSYQKAGYKTETKSIAVNPFKSQAQKIALETQGIHLGDYLTLGTYLGEPIVWRCVAIDENGPLMLSDKILCLKAFDAAGSSPTYHTDGWGYIRESYGWNCWSDSSLRQWLNSEAETVPYSHCPPKASGVLSGYNAYDKEAGFLHAFTQEELAKIKTVTQRMYIHEWETHRSGYCDGGTRELEYWPSKRVVDYSPYYYQNVTDRIFLLTPEQADAIYRNFTGYFEKAYPTEAAVKNSSYKASGLSTSKAYPYWLGLPSNIAISYEHAIVSTQNGLDYPRAYDGTCGVRPAFYLDGYTVIH